MVVGLTLMFALTFGGLVWLARDVDRGVSNQSAAQSIAFQSARSGAQAAEVTALRQGDFVTLDPDAARVAAASTAVKLFDSYGVAGVVESIAIDLDVGKVTVTVRIVDGSTSVVGSGSARPERVE